MLRTHLPVGKTRRWPIAQAWAVCTLLSCCLLQAGPALSQTVNSPLSPPINHETGRIEQVITAADSGYRARQYVLTWRSMHIVVAGAPEESYVPGDNLDVIVYRSEVNGHKVLRFETTPSAANEDADTDSAASSASITLGTARIEDTVSAESDGYRFAGYFVTWHNQRVFVADPQSAPTRPAGETINFRVLRSGLGMSRRLSFAL